MVCDERARDGGGGGQLTPVWMQLEPGSDDYVEVGVCRHLRTYGPLSKRPQSMCWQALARVLPEGLLNALDDGHRVKVGFLKIAWQVVDR